METNLEDKIKARIAILREMYRATAYNPYLTNRGFEILEGISELEWVLNELEKDKI